MKYSKGWNVGLGWGWVLDVILCYVLEGKIIYLGK